jgi:hypothetical protein
MEKFQWQVFISLLLLFVFLGLVLSGVVLYVAPEGSLARWIDWQVLGLGKKEWESLHTVLSFLFLIASLLHILWINGALLLHYFGGSSFARKPIELVVSVLFFLLILAFTVSPFRPLNVLYDGGNRLSDSWGEEVVRPELAEAARLPFRDVLAYMVHPLSAKEAQKQVEATGILVKDSDLQFHKIAKDNDMSPEELYKKLLTLFANNE